MMKKATRKRAVVREPAKTKAGLGTVTDATAAIYEVVKRVPRGRVITYGQIAELAGIARGHRIAARAMRTCPAGLPWQRVVGKKDARRAQVSILDEEHAQLQRRLLIKEGVKLDDAGCISLRDYGWLPT